MSQADITNKHLTGAEPAEQKQPAHHPLWTPECPNVRDFEAIVKNGWPEDRMGHIANGCPYCRKVLVMKVRDTHPEPSRMIEILAFTEGSRDLEWHVDMEGDGCEVCRDLLASEFVQRRMEAFRKSPQASIRIRQGIGVDFARRTLADVPGPNEGRFAAESISADGRLVVRLWETEDTTPELKMSVSNPGGEYRNDEIELELGRPPDLIRKQLRLVGQGRFGAAAELFLGPFKDWAPRILDLMREIKFGPQIDIESHADLSYSSPTEHCLSFPRFFELVLRPSTVTAAEREHLSSGCAFCQKHLAESRQEAWHPNLGLDAEAIRIHVEENGCESVNCRAMYAFRKPILKRVEPVLAELRRYISDWGRAAFGFAPPAALGASPAGAGFSGVNEKTGAVDASIEPGAEELTHGVRISRFPAEPLEASHEDVNVMLWKEGDALRLRVHAPGNTVGSRIRIRVACPNGEILSTAIAIKDVAGHGHGIADLEKKYSELAGGNEWILLPPERMTGIAQPSRLFPVLECLFSVPEVKRFFGSTLQDLRNGMTAGSFHTAMLAVNIFLGRTATSHSVDDIALTTLEGIDETALLEHHGVDHRIEKGVRAIIRALQSPLQLDHAISMLRDWSDADPLEKSLLLAFCYKKRGLKDNLLEEVWNIETLLKGTDDASR